MDFFVTVLVHPAEGGFNTRAIVLDIDEAKKFFSWLWDDGGFAPAE
ncbi:MAG: hypothetical protein J6386_13690 [Candidatus Synoicihabitans palmerolidicus]|nr:hypothetical protein [Candidatus Synoicihabitans palmerolidicus]